MQEIHRMYRNIHYQEPNKDALAKKRISPSHESHKTAIESHGYKKSTAVPIKPRTKATSTPQRRGKQKIHRSECRQPPRAALRTAAPPWRAFAKCPRVTIHGKRQIMDRHQISVQEPSANS